MAEWDTQAICQRILNKARVPRGGRYQTVAALLELVDQHLRTVVTPKLLTVAEDWLTSTATYSVVAGTATYRLPWRSLRVLDVTLLNASGEPMRRFSRASAEQAKGLRTAGWLRKEGRPELWLVEASSLRLYPTPDVSGTHTLAVRYARRPGRLVDSAGTGVWVVTSVDGATLSLFGTGNPSNEPAFDIIRGTPGFESLGDDVVSLGGSGAGTSWTVDLENTEGLEVGDYVALPGTSPVPQVPFDYLAVLEESVVEQLLRGAGDVAGAQTAREAKVDLQVSAEAVLEPRASEPAVIVPDSWL